jgi:hypothetical protein
MPKHRELARSTQNFYFNTTSGGYYPQGTFQAP